MSTFSNTIASEYSVPSGSSLSHDHPLRVRAWVEQGSQRYELELLEVTFAGGCAATSAALPIGGLVRMCIEGAEGEIGICAQIVANGPGTVTFRLYGTSGKPKQEWEAFVALVRKFEATARDRSVHPL